MDRFLRCCWVVVLAWTLYGCARTAPEERLRQTIAAAQQDVESRDAGALAGKVAEDFIGPDGMHRAGLRRMAQAAFLRYPAVGVTLGPMQVELAAGGGHATVRFTAALTGGDGAVLPETARLYHVESGWREAGDAWELTSLSWTGSDSRQGLP